jgi:hypothetical protein
MEIRQRVQARLGSAGFSPLQSPALTGPQALPPVESSAVFLTWTVFLTWALAAARILIGSPVLLAAESRAVLAAESLVQCLVESMALFPIQAVGSSSRSFPVQFSGLSPVQAAGFCAQPLRPCLGSLSVRFLVQARIFTCAVPAALVAGVGRSFGRGYG